MKKYFKQINLDQDELNWIINQLPELTNFIKSSDSICARISTDLFSCLIHTIISQQLSNQVVDTIWSKLVFYFKKITPKSISKVDFSILCDLGLSKAKANTIKEIAFDCLHKKLNLKKMKRMNDKEVYDMLMSYKGIGKWTVDNFLIFGLYRKNILPINDFGILKGLKLVLKKNKLNEEDIKKISSKIDGHLTTLSICLWYISNTN